MNIDQIRADTPGTREVVHLLASGSGLMPSVVSNAIIDHITLEQTIGGYEAHAKQSDSLNQVYTDVAELLNAEAKEIALVENATVGWCHAFYALPLSAGDRILTCEAEYAANYVAFLQRAKRDGVIIDVVPSTKTGEIDVDALESMIDENVKLIAMTWIPTNGGLVNPAGAVGAIARRHNIPYLLDACQAVGQMPVDVKALQCDFLSATGRKFLRGPRGTGFLYVAKKWLDSLEPAMIDHFAAPWVSKDQYELRNDARRFETWENAYALRMGLGAAVRYALNLGLPNIQKRAWELATYAREQISRLPGAKVQDIGLEQCAIVSFTIEGLDPDETVKKLRENAINIGASKPSNTLLDSEARGLSTVLRVAPHYYNTIEELDTLFDSLRKLY